MWIFKTCLDNALSNRFQLWINPEVAEQLKCMFVDPFKLKFSIFFYSAVKNKQNILEDVSITTIELQNTRLEEDLKESSGANLSLFSIFGD